MAVVHWALFTLLAERTPQAIGWALLPAFVLGVFPPTSLQWFLALGCIFIFRFNLMTLIGTAIFFRLFTFLGDPFAHNLGNYLLTGVTYLGPFWARLFHAPIVPFTLFNHTTVLGYFIFGLTIPLLCLGTTSFIRSYASLGIEIIARTYFWQSFSSSRFYRRLSQYARYENR